MANSASIPPSSKGKAAEKTMPAQSTAKLRLDQRALAPHCRPSSIEKAKAEAAIVIVARRRIPTRAASG